MQLFPAMLLAVLPLPLPDLPTPLVAADDPRSTGNQQPAWQKWGPPVAEVVDCPTCPSGKRYTGRTLQYWRDAQGNQAVAVYEAERLLGWTYHWKKPDGTFRSEWSGVGVDQVQNWHESLAPADRRAVERYHWRLTPGSCGMLGCPVHGGGWRLVPSAGPGCAAGRCGR